MTKNKQLAIRDERALGRPVGRGPANYRSANHKPANDAPANRESARRGPVVSRRAFLGFAGAGAAALVIENFFGGARIARAADSNGNEAVTISFVILDALEAAVTVFDAADGITPVSGAVVSITSRYTKNSVQVSTNEAGVAKFSVYKEGASNNLIRDEDFKENDYSFCGSIVVWKRGWRDFETGAMMFTGGEATGVYLKQDDGKPYVRMLSFNDWDIQYCQNTFTSTKENKADHSIVVRVACGSTNMETEVAWWKGTPRTTNYSEYNTGTSRPRADISNKGFAAALSDHTFKHPFLDPASKWFLGIGEDMLHFHIWADRRDRFRIDSKLAVKDGVVPKEDETSKPFPVEFSYYDTQKRTAGDGFGVTVADGIPGIGGSTFSVWAPSFPANIIVYPGVRIIAQCGWRLNGSKEKEGGKDATAWKVDPEEPLSEQCKKQYKDMQKYRNQYKNRGDGTFARTGYTMKCGWSLQIYGGYQAIWNEKGKLPIYKSGELGCWEGDLSLKAVGSASFTATVQFTIGIVPLFVDFSIGGSLGVMADMGFNSLGATLPEIIANGAFVPNGVSPFGISVTFSVSLTVGVGVKCIFTVGLRGGFTFSASPALYYPGTYADPSLSPVRKRYSVGYSVDIVVQAAIFGWAKPLWKGNKSYDSWKPEANELEGAVDTASVGIAGHSLAELDAGFAPMSGEVLLGIAEFSAVPNEEAYAAWAAAEAQGASLDADGPSEAGELPGAHRFTYAPAEGAGVQAGASFDELDEGLFATLANSPASADGEPSFDDVVTAELSPNGILPSREVCFAKDVFSDARVKVLDVDGVSYLFRIVTVGFEENGGTVVRARLTMAAFDESAQCFGEPTVVLDGIDIDQSLSDFDFDVCDTGWDKARIWGIVVRGPRENSFSETITKTSCVGFFIRTGGTKAYRAKEMELPGNTFYSLPRIVSFEDLGARSHICCFALFAQEFVQSDDGSYALSESFVSAGLMGSGNPFYISLDYARYASSKTDACKARSSFGIDSMELLPMSAMEEQQELPKGHPGAGSYFLVAFSEVTDLTDASGNKRRRMGFFYVASGYGEGERPGNVTYPHSDDDDYDFKGSFTVWNIELDGATRRRWLVTEGDTTDAEGKVIDSPHLNAYAPKRYNLDVSSPYLELSCTDVGPEDKAFIAKHFAVSPDGWTIYYPASQQVPGEVTEDDEGNLAYADAAETLYQIWGAQLIKCSDDGSYRFREPFAVAQMAHPVDSLECFNYKEDSQYSFVYKTGKYESASDPEEKLDRADLYFAAVPYTMAATILSAQVLTPAVKLGGELDLRITVRNDGNVALGDYFYLSIMLDGTTRGYSPAVHMKDYVASYDDVPNKVSGGEEVDMGGEAAPSVGGVDYANDIDAACAGKEGAFLAGATNAYNVKVDMSDMQDVFTVGEHAATLEPWYFQRYVGAKQGVSALSVSGPGYELAFEVGSTVELGTDAEDASHDVVYDYD